jgi:hypothetical protein
MSENNFSGADVMSIYQFVVQKGANGLQILPNQYFFTNLDPNCSATFLASHRKILD